MGKGSEPFYFFSLITLFRSFTMSILGGQARIFISVVRPLFRTPSRLKLAKLPVLISEI